MREGHIIYYISIPESEKIHQEYLANWYSSVRICSHIYDNHSLTVKMKRILLMILGTVHLRVMITIKFIRT